jgi:hypothetical protein
MADDGRVDDAGQERDGIAGLPRRLLGPHARREWERKLMTAACR